MSFETEEQEKQRIHKARIKTQALAILSRSKKAGIPERFLRIGPHDFKDLLSEEYHGGSDGVDQMTDFIYKQPDKLFKIPFILIDGGSIESRKRAGFAILFRLISCDHFGLYKDCADVVHRMQTFVSEAGVNRNDFTNIMKEQDVIFISEFYRPIFSAHLDGGNYFDEFLGYRSDKLKPTIVSFSATLNSHNKITDNTCGRYLASLSAKEYVDTSDPFIKYDDYILRVRVKL